MKQRIKLDFAARGLRLGWPEVVLIGLVVVAVAALAFGYQKLSRALAQDRDEISRLLAAQQASKRETASVLPAVSAERAKAINAAIGQLNVPWGDMLRALDRARPPGVTLLAMEPDAARSTLRIVAEADTSAELFGFAEAVARSAPFRHYAPVKQNQVTALGRPRVQLSLELQWAS